jgi:integrase
MKHNRFWLWRRKGVFYLQDAETRRKESLHTRDRSEAQRLRDARNEAAARPVLGVALAKAYLSAQDPKLAARTWQEVIDQYCSRGNPDTQANHRAVSNRKPQSALQKMKVIETTADDILGILKSGGVMTHAFVRGLHNLAIGLGWLPWPILPLKLWPVVETKSKRGITKEEHQKILSTEKNAERRLYYELLWEIGAAQSDAAALKSENIQWDDRILSYQRKKTGSWSHVRIGNSLENLLRKLPSQGMLFPKWGMATNNDRAAEFRRRCRILKIEGVSLHSYRYAWAERAKTFGYPERYAMENLGHGSKAVTRAYAKKAHVILPPLEEYEAKIIQRRPQIAVQSADRKMGVGV